MNCFCWHQLHTSSTIFLLVLNCTVISKVYCDILTCDVMSSQLLLLFTSFYEWAEHFKKLLCKCFHLMLEKFQNDSFWDSYNLVTYIYWCWYWELHISTLLSLSKIFQLNSIYQNITWPRIIKSSNLHSEQEYSQKT